MAADNSFRQPKPDSIRSAAEWIGVGVEERGKVIRELLNLTDALRPWPSRCLSLPDKVISTHRCLAEADIPHAIGGALALGYFGEPRSTLDIDVNVFVVANCWPAVRAARMHEAIRKVPFAAGSIPVVAPEHLVIRKALLDRTKDWIDIEQILVATDPLDLPEIDDWLGRMAGQDDPRVRKLGEIKAALSLD